MKLVIAIAISITWLNKTQGQLLPVCIKEMALANYKDCRIKTALLKKDTCYVIEAKLDPSKMTRHALFEMNRKRTMPEYILPDVYSKTCNRIQFLRNKDVVYTLRDYSWGEISYKKKN